MKSSPSVTGGEEERVSSSRGQTNSLLPPILLALERGERGDSWSDMQDSSSPLGDNVLPMPVEIHIYVKDGVK